MIDRDTQRRDVNVRGEPLEIEDAFFQVRLACPLEDCFTLRGEPNNMGLMVVCPVGTERDLHAHMGAKPSNENLRPSAAGFHAEDPG
jgi:hypothetical protein